MTKRKELKLLLVETKRAYQNIGTDLAHFEDIFEGQLLQWIVENVKVKAPTKRSILRLWKRWTKLVRRDQNEVANNLIGEIEKELPFKDQEEHQKWLDCLFTFKFWEDFEGMTLNIINRLKQEKKYEKIYHI